MHVWSIAHRDMFFVATAIATAFRHLGSQTQAVVPPLGRWKPALPF